MSRAVLLLLLLLAMALSIAGPRWLVTESASPDEVDAFSRAASQAARAPFAGARIADLLADRSQLLLEEPETVGAADPLATSAGIRVLVHGIVRRGGLPADGYDVWFDPLTEGGAQEKRGDWDFTDAEGYYAVELDPGDYECCGEEGTHVARVQVGEDLLALELHLDLLPGS